MLHQLANMPDNELMGRARKLKDEEAAGILLDRYSHLLAAVSLPSLNNYDNTPEEFFPSLLQRLFKSLHTQTIPRIGEWMQFFIKSQSSREARNTYYFPTSASSDITRLENKADKANSNLLQRKELNATMKAAFEELDSSHKEILKEFYFDQKTFAEIAADREYTMDKIRKMIKRSKQELASLIIEKLEYAKVNRVYAASEEEAIKEENEVAEAKLEYAPAENEGQAPALVVKKVTTRKQKQDPSLVVEKATFKKQQQGPALIVEKATSKKQKQGPGLVIENATPKKQKQGPALVLVSAKSEDIEPAPALVLVETSPITDNQEQDLNQGYATSRKQGQDIKDLQQGSLF
jgi:predicted DNA-binding protein (MmcQ/YjbR family)